MSESYDQVRAALRVLARLNRVLESADSGLTVPQYRMLTALDESNQRSARLAERLAIRKPTVTALADGLIAAGYAERQSEPGDRRIVRLHITEAGRAALARAEQVYAARLGPLLEAVPDEGLFFDALVTIGRAMDNRAAALHSDAHAGTAAVAPTGAAVTAPTGAAVAASTGGGAR